MNIELKAGMVKQFLAKHPDKAIEDTMRWCGDNEAKAIQLDHRSDEELDMLEQLAASKPDDKPCQVALRRIASFRNIKLDPGGKRTAMLEPFEQALKLYVGKLQNHWLFEDDGGALLPLYVSKIQYHPYDASSETAAYVNMSLEWLERGHKKKKNVSWDAADLRATKGGVTACEALAAAKLYPPTTALLAAYVTTMTRYAQVRLQQGHQFTAEGDAQVVGGYWRSGTSAMVRDGVAVKLVMDDRLKCEEDENAEAYGDDGGTVSDAFWAKDKDASASVALPQHPTVQLFDLDQHQYVVLSADQLRDYVWNPNLGDKLILPEKHKDVVAVLMETASDEMVDIVAGKSGGTIVIATGVPGTGKTLTAEVTSEVVKRPLYKVQCSQLGTDEEAIEKRLKKVFLRATRWKALLLIDEADVYVRARGEDIQQNAIVGVFLRVLEYYRGVLFLTSNMATIIDDAIMSRATVHLKYGKPTDDALAHIWGVLGTQFGLPLSEAEVAALVKTFPGITGRDVKSLIKLAVRYARHKKQAVTLDTFKLVAEHKDIVEASF